MAMETPIDRRRRRKRTTANARYHARKERKQCTRCNNYVSDLMSRCDTCRLLHNAKKRETYHARLDANMCTRCGEKPAAPGKSKCEDDLRIEAHEHMETFKLLAKNGLCRRCKQDVVPNHKHCRACLDYCLARTHERRYNLV